MRLCIGLSLTRAQSPTDFIRLWAHEYLRVYRDRLVNNEDRAWFDQLIKGLVPKYFKMDWSEVVEVGMSHLIYGDFMVPNADNKLYNEIKDTTKMVATVRASPRQL